MLDCKRVMKSQKSYVLQANQPEGQTHWWRARDYDNRAHDDGQHASQTSFIIEKASFIQFYFVYSWVSLTLMISTAVFSYSFPLICPYMKPVCIIKVLPGSTKQKSPSSRTNLFLSLFN